MCLLGGDELLADRGFLVSEEMAALGVTLRMPSFTRGKKQLSSKDVEMSKNLAMYEFTLRGLYAG